MRIARVFPRVTRATPCDQDTFYGPPDLFADVYDEAHISVAFTADLAKAERLAYDWQGYAKAVKIGGPALNMRSEDFVPGKYIKHGYVITSRGCPCTCWFCNVWKRENDKPKDGPRELPIHDGWNVLDDNLLACSRPHVEAVFAMLRRQKRRACFTGGLWAAGLKDYQVGLLADLKPEPACMFAYDPGDHFDTLKIAADRIFAAGFSKRSHRVQVYVLIGFPNDTMSDAEVRLRQMVEIGFTPFAMLLEPMNDKEEKHRPGEEWFKFRRAWCRPAIIHASGVKT